MKKLFKTSTLNLFLIFLSPFFIAILLENLIDNESLFFIQSGILIEILIINYWIFNTAYSINQKLHDTRQRNLTRRKSAFKIASILIVAQLILFTITQLDFDLNQNIYITVGVIHILTLISTSIFTILNFILLTKTINQGLLETKNENNKLTVLHFMFPVFTINSINKRVLLIDENLKKHSIQQGV